MEPHTDFENRYRFSMPAVQSKGLQESAKQNYRKLADENIQRLRQVPNRPKSLRYFESLLQNPSQRVSDLEAFKESGGKVVGVFCIQVPEELILAAGAVAIRLDCGFYDSVALGEETVPKNTCPLIKSSVGFNAAEINPLFKLCDLLIIPTTCDGKKKLADILSNQFRVWTLELPADKDNPSAKGYWLEQIANLKSRLEEWTGRTIKKSSLKQSVQLLQKRTALARNLLESRKEDPPLLSGRDSYLVMQAAFFDDVRKWNSGVQELLDELETMKRPKELRPRILVTGSALVWPNMKLLNIMRSPGPSSWRTTTAPPGNISTIRSRSTSGR